MSANVSITWANPTERVDGGPLDEFDVHIGQRAVGAPEFTEVAVVPHTEPASLSLPNVPGGDFELEFVVRADERQSEPVVVSFSVPFARPNPVTSVNVNVG